MGLDCFDPAKLEAGAAEAKWLGEMAIRHNSIVGEAAGHGPVLPMQLGVIFQSRASLLDRLVRRETAVAEFLRWLGDRREWAVKVYLDEPLAERSLLPADPATAGPSDRPGPPHAAPGQGTRYLAARRLHQARSGQLQAAVRQELSALGEALQAGAETWRLLPPLPRGLVDRSQKMVWNAAFLLDRCNEDSFHAACQRLRGELAPKGLLLETSGPWPAYHFRPTLATEGENNVASLAGR